MDTSVEKAVSYLDTVESRVGDLLKEVPEGTIRETPVDILIRPLKRVKNLAHAYRTYPMFDILCLSQMTEREVEVWEGREKVSGSENKKLKLFLPTFAWGSIGYGSVDRSMRIRLPLYHECFGGSLGVSFPDNLRTENEQRLGPLGYNNSAQRQGFEAVMPAIPDSVNRNIDRAREYFDTVMLVWEAQWTPAPVADPLVVGVVHDICFLVDQYDVTAKERYIASEFVRKAE